MEVGFREIFLATFYTILLIFGFTGNSMVLAVVYRNKNRKMRSISNIFIVSMSASDIMILVSHLPYLIYNLFEKKWLATGIFGHVICGIFKLLVYLSTDVSMLSLAIVAADRFWAIYHPTRQRITARIAKKIIATTWLFSASLSLPIVATVVVKQDRCFLDISSEILSHYTKCYVTLFVFVPLLTMASFYVSVGIKLRRHRIPGYVSKENAAIREKQNRRITKMLVMISSLFILCWFPYGTVHFLFTLQNNDVPNYLFDITSCLAYSKCALNPCIYFIYSQQFRFAFKDICSLMSRCIVAECRVENRESELHKHNSFENNREQLPQDEGVQTVSTKL